MKPYDFLCNADVITEEEGGRQKAFASKSRYKICICLGGQTFKGVILGFIHVMYCTFFRGFCFSLICNSLL